MTFFWSSLDVGRKFGRRRRDDLFFVGLHLILGGKLNVGRRDDLFFFFFLVFTWFWEENWTSEDVMTLFLVVTWFWVGNWTSRYPFLGFSWDSHEVVRVRPLGTSLETPTNSISWTFRMPCGTAQMAEWWEHLLLELQTSVWFRIGWDWQLQFPCLTLSIEETVWRITGKFTYCAIKKGT